MCPGDPLGNHRQRPIAVSLVFEPVLAHEDGMGVPAPLPHQGRAGVQRSAGVERTSAFLELSRQNPKAALQGAGRAAMGALLQLIGETPDDQIATEAQRRSGMMQCPPRTPQLLCRPRSNRHATRDSQKRERICWGTEGSNPSPSSGESANFQFLNAPSFQAPDHVLLC